MLPKIFLFIFKYEIKIDLIPLNICDQMHDWFQKIFLEYTLVTAQIYTYYRCYRYTNTIDIIDIITFGYQSLETGPLKFLLF